MSSAAEALRHYALTSVPHIKEAHVSPPADPPRLKPAAGNIIWHQHLLWGISTFPPFSLCEQASGAEAQQNQAHLSARRVLPSSEAQVHGVLHLASMARACNKGIQKRTARGCPTVRSSRLWRPTA